LAANVKSDLTKILDSSTTELKDLQGKSMAWFRKEVSALRRVGRMTSGALLRGDTDMKFQTVMPGKMYMYSYDPKYKDTLPYYDAFPLVIPFRREATGFYGLKLHYLPYHIRAQLLTKMMQFVTNKKMNETTKLKFTWGMVGAASRFAAVKPCVKHYLFDHVQSQFKLILPDDWATTIMLPCEQFVGASSNKVWRDSLKIIGS